MLRANMKTIEEKFEKAKSHKYLRRLGVPKAYRYIYAEPQAKVKEKWATFDDWEKRGKTMKMERPFGLHEPTEREMDHEEMRVRTMSERALMARVYKIKDPQKMYGFIFALDNAGMRGVAGMARQELAKMGYGWGGEVLKPQGFEKPKPIGPKYQQHKVIAEIAEKTAAKKQVTGSAIINYLNRMIDKNYSLDEWNNMELDERNKLEINWMLKKFDVIKLTTKEINKIKDKLEDENYHGPAAVFYAMIGNEYSQNRLKELGISLGKPKVVLPAKGEKIKGREPRHIILADDPEHDAYREALLAKEKKEGGVKKDKAGNIIADKIARSKGQMTEGVLRAYEKEAKKRMKEDPWAGMPGYGRTYKMESPFSEKYTASGFAKDPQHAAVISKHGGSRITRTPKGYYRMQNRHHGKWETIHEGGKEAGKHVIAHWNEWAPKHKRILE